MPEKWNWHLLIIKLIENSIVNNADQAYEMNFIEMMEWLCFIKDKEDYIKAEEDKQNNRLTT